MEELHFTASADHLAKVDLESKQHRMHGDSSRLEKRLAAAEADRESLSQQLKASICLPDLSVTQVMAARHFAARGLCCCCCTPP